MTGNNPEDKFAVVYCSDGNDFRRLTLSARSVKKYMGDSTRIILLTDKTEGIPDIVDEYHNPNPILNELGLHDRGWNRKWPFATLFRLAIPLMNCFNKYSRILYLDTDILCRSDVTQCMKTVNLLDSEISGAFDHESKIFRKFDFQNGDDLSEECKNSLREKIWSKTPTLFSSYINAGVTVWNLDQIRKNGLGWYKQRLKWFWESEILGKFKMLDQDFINIMMNSYCLFNKGFNHFAGDHNTRCIFQHFVCGTKGNMLEVAKSMGID